MPQVRTTPAEEGIVYVDAAGQLTFANDAARALLGWRTGSLALGDVLAGGSREATTLLQSVARHELIEQPLTLYAGAATQRLDASALALRDRDGNLWGAALFLRRPQ
jgi:PAS domain-containing protein